MLNLPCSCIPCHTSRTYTPDSPRFSESLPLKPMPPPPWLFYLYAWSNFSRIIFLQTSLSPLSFPTFVKSMPTHLHILIQYKIVFLFFLYSSSTSLFHLSNSFNHPNTSAFVNLSFLILNSYPILSSTLFSTFHLTDLTPNLVLTSIMFSYLAWISLYGCYLTTSKILITFI